MFYLILDKALLKLRGLLGLGRDMRSTKAIPVVTLSVLFNKEGKRAVRKIWQAPGPYLSDCTAFKNKKMLHLSSKSNFQPYFNQSLAL